MTIQRDSHLAGVFRRQEFFDEFHTRHQPGEHVLFLGPTGRGKTTLAAEMLMVPSTPLAVVLSVKGRDPALSRLGTKVKIWPPPPKSLWQRIREYFDPPPVPQIYRWEPQFHDEASLPAAARVVARSLRWLWSQHNVTMYLPDLQIIADRGMMGQGKLIEAHLLTARSRDTSLWLDAQAPRWIPRAAYDQVSHIFIFANHDIDVVRRLREIAGLRMDTIQRWMEAMGFHETLWVDIKRDDYFLIEAK